MGGRIGSCSLTLFSPADTDETVRRAPKDSEANDCFILDRDGPSDPLDTRSFRENSQIQLRNGYRYSRNARMNGAQRKGRSAEDVEHDVKQGRQSTRIIKSEMNR